MKLLEPSVVGNLKFLTCESESGETVDSVVLGMMSNNDIEGLLPMTAQQMDDVWKFRYDVTRMETLNRCRLALDVAGELRVLEQMCEITVRLRDYAIDEDSLVLDDTYIYLNNTDGKIYLVCVPLENAEKTSLREYCEDKIRQLYSRRAQYGGLCRELIKCLRNENFDCHAFAETIKRNLALMSVHTRESVVTANKYNNSVAGDGAVLLRRAGNEMCAPAGETVLVSEQEHSAQNDLAGPIDLRRGRGFSSEEVDETVLVQDDYGKEQDNQTMLLDLDDEATSLLRNKAFLVRKSTNEKIEITSDVFCIGKSSRDLDYRIEGNPAISRYHAKIIRKESGYFIKDTDSKNHTYVDREKIKSGMEIPLSDGMSVRLANEEFKFTIETT